MKKNRPETKKKWSEGEKKKLCDIFRHYTAHELEVIFKRTYHAIHQKAIYIGFRYNKPRKPTPYQVCLKITNVTYIVSAFNRTEAIDAAVAKFQQKIQTRTSFNKLVIKSKSKIIPIKQWKNNPPSM